MNKIIILLVSLSLLAGVFGCSNSSQSYSFQEAIDKGDVVYLNKIYNLDKFERFITNLRSKKADTIRITGYTDEGDPIYKDLRFDGKTINYTYDNSNDKFGGTDKGIRMDTCSNVSSEENTNGEIDYKISGCTKNDSEMSYFLFRMYKE
ncbi:DUF4362 domain-containing protein [Paenibacillus tuaregi]|uniref:DUF4362 domain-containing protein n=1 Tax=Paenibacillus tuaregi TaxID=1816681 RepID=UPI000838A50E|nr:DUF4362 domain-containing protein [Paenibacillus tuaregi]